MLDQQDKNDIRQISKEVTTEVIKQVMPEILEDYAGNIINPAFQQFENRMNERFDKLESEIQQRPTTTIVTGMLEGTERRLMRNLGDKPA